MAIHYVELTESIDDSELFPDEFFDYFWLVFLEEGYKEFGPFEIIG